MSLIIKELSPETEQNYKNFLTTTPDALLYHSLKYRNFLRQVLYDAEDRYLLAYENDELVAAFPTFVKKGFFGTVINSLPFYGSNGSIISKKKCTYAVKKKLLNAFESLSKNEEGITSTVIENPMNRERTLFNDYKPDYLDERIGQFTPLPAELAGENVGDNLFRKFHSKTRNMIRKGEKSGFTIEKDDSKEALRELHALHTNNMQAIGGKAKPWAVFEAISDHFEYDQDYRIYVAKHKGTVASALLVFFFNNTAEYFIPAIHEPYKSQQPLSYLIFLAMLDATSKGCLWWNWGGTWLTQEGVYHFKSRWGTRDMNYKYYIKFHSDPSKLRHASKGEILSSYPNFYVLPFSGLAK